MSQLQRVTKEQAVKTKKITKKMALQAAFDVCFIMHDFTNNVIATQDDNVESDIKINQQSEIFIEWYKQHCKY